MSIADVVSRADPQEELMLDPATLDPNRHYRWVRFQQTQIAKFMRLGYKVESRKDSKVKISVEVEQPPDDYIHNGDGILMSCEAKKHGERRMRNIQLTELRKSYPTQEFRRRHQQLGAAALKSRVVDSDDED